MVHKYEEHLIRRVADLLHVPHSGFIAAKLRAARTRRIWAGDANTRLRLKITRSVADFAAPACGARGLLGYGPRRNLHAASWNKPHNTQQLQKILVLNPKGGSGKSTIATNLAAYYAWQGLRVALMDHDPQGSSMRWLKLRPAGPAADPRHCQRTRKSSA